MDNPSDALIIELCKSRIERLTKQLDEASYWKKPWIWRTRLEWKDRLDFYENKAKVSP